MRDDTDEHEPVEPEAGEDFGPFDQGDVEADQSAFDAWVEGDPDRRQTPDRRAARVGGRRATDPPVPLDPMTAPRTVPCPTCLTPLTWTRAAGLKGQTCTQCGHIFTGKERNPRLPLPGVVAPPPEPITELPPWDGPAVHLMDPGDEAPVPDDPGPFVMPPKSSPSFDLPGALVGAAHRIAGWWWLVTYAGVLALVVIFTAGVVAHNLAADERRFETRRLDLQASQVEADARAAEAALKVDQDRLALERQRFDAEQAERDRLAALRAIPTIPPETTTTTSRR